MTLRIFAITKPGLVALALAVSALWTCVGLETAARQRSIRDATASVQTLARLRHLTEGTNLRNLPTPARAPIRSFHVTRPFAS